MYEFGGNGGRKRCEHIIIQKINKFKNQIHGFLYCIFFNMHANSYFSRSYILLYLLNMLNRKQEILCECFNFPAILKYVDN